MIYTKTSCKTWKAGQTAFSLIITSTRIFHASQEIPYSTSHLCVLRLRSTVRLSQTIRSVATGTQWSIPMKLPIVCELLLIRTGQTTGNILAPKYYIFPINNVTHCLPIKKKKKEEEKSPKNSKQRPPKGTYPD